ncbi:hypothetical protein [Acidisoma sp. C75]
MPSHLSADLPSALSPAALAARRILDAYLAHHRLTPVEAARLALQIDALMTELQRQGMAKPDAAIAGASAIAVAEPRGAVAVGRKRPAPRRSALPEAPDMMAEEVAVESVVTEEVEAEEVVAEDALPEAAAAEAAEAAMPAPPPEPATPKARRSSRGRPPAPPEAPAPPAAKLVPEPSPEVLPLSPMPVSASTPTAAEAEGAAPAEGGRKRKRPPRPAHKRRAAQIAAIEAMLVEGEEPPPYEADGEG